MNCQEAINHLDSNEISVGFDYIVSDLYKNYPSISESGLVERYSEFCNRGKGKGLQKVEQLVPLAKIPYQNPLAAILAKEEKEDSDAMKVVSAFPPSSWGYYLPLSKQVSTLGEEATLNSREKLSKMRSLYRLNFITSGISNIYDGNLSQKTLLDMACNWGAFSIEAVLKGVKSCVGFDIRQENVNKAIALKQYFGLSNIDFLKSDVYKFDSTRKFDIVLNLGLFYHITQPYELMATTYSLCNEIAVIDTITHREPFSGFILGTGENSPTHAATAVGGELHPTYRGLIDLAYMVGFKDVIELKGLPQDGWSNFDVDPYGNGTRRCIVAFK